MGDLNEHHSEDCEDKEEDGYLVIYCRCEKKLKKRFHTLSVCEVIWCCGRLKVICRCPKEGPQNRR